jgi:hypothetical protein
MEVGRGQEGAVLAWCDVDLTRSKHRTYFIRTLNDKL